MGAMSSAMLGVVEVRCKKKEKKKRWRRQQTTNEKSSAGEFKGFQVIHSDLASGGSNKWLMVDQQVVHDQRRPNKSIEP